MERNKAIDIAKGIAIICMVVGHCYCEHNYVLQIIYAFHMPFFFIASGILYGAKSSGSVCIDFKKQCGKLLTPYFFFEIAFTLFVTILSRSVDTLPEKIIHVFTLDGVTVTWFLPCLLIAEVIFTWIINNIKPKKLCIGVFVLLVLIGTVVRGGGTFLFILRRSFVGTGFLAIGYYGKNLYLTKSKKSLLSIAALSFLILALVNGPISMVTETYANPVLFIINGCLGSFVLIQVCILLNTKVKLSEIEYFGTHTMEILCTHMFAVEIIRLIDYKVFNDVLKTLGIFEGIVFGCLILLIMKRIIPLCNRFLWFAFGRKLSSSKKAVVI